MKWLSLILFSYLWCNHTVTQGQKIKNVYYEIEEQYHPEVILPSEVNSYSFSINNESGYDHWQIDLNEYFEGFSQSSDPDLEFYMYVGETEITDFDIIYDYSGTDAGNYLATLTLDTEVNSGVYYRKGGYNVYWDTEEQPFEMSFRVYRSEIEEQDDKLYFSDLEAVHQKINNRFIDRALAGMNSFSKDLMPTKSTITTGVYTVSDKKQDYSEIEEATDLLQKGFENYLAHNKQEAQNNLSSGAKILVPFLDQANFEDKKAYINKKVASAIVGNLAFAYEYAEQYDQALKMLDIMDEKLMRLPGAFYYDPTFVENWRERIKEKRVSVNDLRPDLQEVFVSLNEKEQYRWIRLQKLESNPYTSHTLKLFESLHTLYLDQDFVGVGIEELLYGSEPRTKISAIYGLDSIKGIGFINYEKQGNLGLLQYRVFLNQEVKGDYHVLRFFDYKRGSIAELSLPEKSFSIDGIYHQFELGVYPSGIQSFRIVHTASSAEYQGMLKSLPKDFPFAELKKTRTDYSVKVDLEGHFAISDLETIELKTKVDFNLIALRDLRNKKRKQEFLSLLESNDQLDPDLKKKLTKSLLELDENYFYEQ